MENRTRTLMLDFYDVHGKSERLGPLEQLRFEGKALIADGKIVARQDDHEWRLIEGGSYTRLACERRASFHFEAGKDAISREFGPYGSFSSIDGITYADRQVIAFYDEQYADWYSYDLGSHWKAVVLTPS